MGQFIPGIDFFTSPLKRVFSKNFLAAGIMFLSCLQISNAQFNLFECPEITASQLSSLGPFCTGDQVTMSAFGMRLPDGDSVIWYIGNSPTFNPYAGGGKKLCGGLITTPCTQLFTIVQAYINPFSPGDGCEEVLVLNSGAGINIDELQVTLNGVLGGPWVPGNLSKISGCTAISVGPGDWVPPQSFLLIQTSAGPGATINCNSLCTGFNMPLFVVASANTDCSFEWLSDTYDGTPEYTVTTSCGSATLTYSTPNGSNNGDWYSNNQGIVNFGNMTPGWFIPTPLPVPSFIEPCTFTFNQEIIDEFCSSPSKVVYIKGVVVPPLLPPACQSKGVTQAFPITLSCPKVNVKSNSPVCEGSPIELEVLENFSSYSWSGPGGWTSTEQNPVISGTTFANAGVYSVTATDTNGCGTSGSTTVVITPTFLSSIVPSDPEFCSGKSTQLEIIPDPAGNFYSYQWLDPDGGIGSNPTYTALKGGVYTVTVDDGKGCINIKSILVKENLSPIVKIEPPIPTICAGQSIDLTAKAINGTGTLIYQWSTPKGISMLPIVSADVPGSYKVTVTDTKGCTSTDAKLINQGNKPNVITTVDTVSICGGGGVLIKDTVSGGTPGYTFEWTGVKGMGDSLKFFATDTGTLFLIVTDSFGCKDTGITKILFGGTLSAVLDPPNPAFCAGGSTALNANVTGSVGIVKYQWLSPSGITGTNSTFLTNEGGLHQITITDDSGCSFQSSINVTIYPNPIGMIEPVTGFCDSKPVTVQATASGGTGNYQYQWSTPTGVETGSSILAQQGGLYHLTVTDDKGCKHVTIQNIEKWNNPTAVPDQLSPTFCGGGSTVLSGQGSGGTAPYTYGWNGTGGVSTDSFIQVSITGPMTFTVTDAHGCTSSATVNVGSSNGLTVNITPNPAGFCAGGNALLSVITAGGTGNYISYQWSSSTSTYSGNPLSVNTAGIYTVTVTDDEGCTGTDQVEVKSQANLFVSIQAVPTVICNNQPVNLEAIANGGQSPFIYNWQTPAGPATGGMIPASVGGVYQVSVTDNNGCIGTTSLNLKAAVPMQLALNPPNPTFCIGGDVTITLDIQGGDAPFKYNWNTPGGIFTGYPLVANAASTNYAVTVTDANDCTVIQTFEVKSGSSLSVKIQPDTSTICMGNAAQFSVTPVTNNIVWTTPQGTFNTPNIQLNQTGKVIVTVQDNSGCTGSDTAYCIQGGSLVVEIKPVTLSLCSGQPGILEVIGADQGSSYSWTIPGGGGQSGNPLQVILAGGYVVTVTNNGCSGTANATVAVNPTPEIGVVPSATVICNGKPVTLKATVFSGNVIQYQWITPPGVGNVNGQEITTDKSGTYICIASSPDVCSDTFLIELIHSDIVPDIGVTEAGCEPGAMGDIIVNDLISTTNTLKYSIDGGAKQILPTSTPTSIAQVSPGTHTLTIEDTLGCSTTETVTIPQAKGPDVNLGADVTIDLGNATTIIANASVDVINYSWGPVNYLSCTNCIQTQASPPFDIDVYCIVENAAGCRSIDTMRIFVKNDVKIYVPNVFSPDVNGINDQFYLYTDAKLIQEIEAFRVFNKWGDLMYEQFRFPANDPKYGWDGTSAGRPVNPDVYVYFFKVKLISGKELIIKGDVTVIK